ncbi:hypothetical protein J6590_008017 [Homalodisca vitripennis]|nr:hypothetical protein J6590_008017 [Homalodisca vitripennis]
MENGCEGDLWSREPGELPRSIPSDKVDTENEPWRPEEKFGNNSGEAGSRTYNPVRNKHYTIECSRFLGI